MAAVASWLSQPAVIAGRGLNRLSTVINPTPVEPGARVLASARLHPERNGLVAGRDRERQEDVTTHAYLIRGIVTLGIAQALSWVGELLMIALLPRYLGDVNLGKFVFAWAFTNFIGVGADLGVGTYLIKQIARSPDRAGALISNAMTMRIPLSLAAAALSVTVANTGDFDLVSRRVIYALSVVLVISSISNLAYAALQGLHAMRAMAFSAVVGKLANAGLTAAVLLAGAGPIEVSTVHVVGAALGLGAALVALSRRVRLVPKVEWIVWRALLLGGLPFFTWQAALVVYGQIDTVLLRFLSHDAVVGWYGAAYRLVSLPIFVPTIVMTVAFPALSAAVDGPTFSLLARRAIRLISFVSVPMTFGIALLSDRIIELLHYPPGFTNSIVPIVLLSFHIPLVGVDMILGAVLNARDRQRQWALTAVAAAALNPLLNLVAIPYTQSTFGNGAIGAAAITTLTEVFMLTVGSRLVPAGIFGRANVADVLKCVGCAVLMAPVVWVARELPIGVPVVAGAIVYAATSVAFKVISLGELRQVQAQLMRRASAAPASS